MWEPVGPLPAAVYRRRRRIAAAVVLSVVVLVPTAVSLVRRSDDQRASATRTALTAPAAGPATAVPDRDGSGATGADSGAGPVVVPTAAVAAATSGPLPAGTEQLRPDDAPQGSVPVAPPVAVPPTGPVPCTNAMIRTTAAIDAPVHRVGDHPVLRLGIVDISPQPCVRDLDLARQEIVVWSGDGRVRLWSSNDCGNPSAPDLRTLVPQQPVVSAVTWAGRTSTPGCAVPRTAVPAGSYHVLTRLDNIISGSAPFRLTP